MVASENHGGGGKVSFEFVGQIEEVLAVVKQPPLFGDLDFLADDDQTVSIFAVRGTILPWPHG